MNVSIQDLSTVELDEAVTAALNDPDLVAPTHLLLDLASLRFTIQGTTVTVSTSTGEKLGTAVLSQGIDPREGCLAALEDAAVRAHVWRAPSALLASPTDPSTLSRVQLAFYNPHTGQVTLGAATHTVVFQFDGAVAFPLEGMLATIVATTSTLSPATCLLTDTGAVGRQVTAPSLHAVMRDLVSVREAVPA